MSALSLDLTQSRCREPSLFNFLGVFKILCVFCGYCLTSCECLRRLTFFLKNIVNRWGKHAEHFQCLVLKNISIPDKFREIQNFLMNFLVFRETSDFFCEWNCRGGPERRPQQRFHHSDQKLRAGGHFYHYLNLHRSASFCLNQPQYAST